MEVLFFIGTLTVEENGARIHKRINMPYKSERIKIEGTKYDRRVKLSDDQKEYVKWLREEEGLSYSKLAKMFGVSRSLIQIIINKEKGERIRELAKIRRAKGLVRKPTKEEWAATVREHRRYKQKLYMENKIG